MGLREKNRRLAMRETQAIALPMFEERGFEVVTVEEIATRAEMAPSTVFRHFGTKEHIVLWDEHDAALDAELSSRLRKQAPFDALRDGFVACLGGRYDAEPEFQLRRVRLIYATEALHGAAVEADFRAKAELAAGLKTVLKHRRRADAALRAGLLAGGAMLALDHAVDRWQQEGGRRPLSFHIREAFDHVGHLRDVL